MRSIHGLFQVCQRVACVLVMDACGCVGVSRTPHEPAALLERPSLAIEKRAGDVRALIVDFAQATKLHFD